MIKFFRKIRQKMLSENKFSKYLIYSIGEIVLVVIGILIALQINNWNEERIKKIELQEHLKIMVENLNDGLDIPLGTSIELVGISSSGEIIAWIDSSSDNKGTVVMWRRLNLIERIFQKHGISLGV